MPFSLVSGVFFKYATGGLLFLSLVLGARLWLEIRSSAKKDTQIERQAEKIENLEKDLARISEAKNNQGAITTRTVERVVRGDPEVKIITKTIREAPLEKDCKTPALETLRDAL